MTYALKTQAHRKVKGHLQCHRQLSVPGDLRTYYGSLTKHSSSTGVENKSISTSPSVLTGTTVSY